MFFSPADKLVYTAPTGAKFDPLALHRKLTLAGGGNLNSNLAAWSEAASTEPDKAVAEEALVATARSAFGLKPFTEEGGCLDAVALDCLSDFLEWLEKNG